MYFDEFDDFPPPDHYKLGDNIQVLFYYLLILLFIKFFLCT